MGNLSEASLSLLTNLRRAADLVRGFKQVAVDQSSEQRRLFNLKEYLDEILLSLKPQLKRTSHVLTLECPGDIILDSYPGAFSQIISNLVINSLIHGFEGVLKGHIIISASESDDGVHLRYTDDGCGIPAEHAPRIFEPFFSTKRNHGGSGLGLHIVHSLITDTMGGRIGWRSRIGEGVRFDIWIPYRRESVNVPT
jgi:signal transduction histidine kinase